MKTILVPTDFSKHAEYALKVAAQIAKENNSEIILLHMLELPHQGSDAVSKGSNVPQIMHLKELALEKLEDLMDADYLKGIKVLEIVQFEKVFQGISNLSKINNVDFIVMGSHGTSGFQELFIGSNTEKVVRYAEVPVLIIKNEIKIFNPKNFVFVSDFSKEINKPFEQVLEIATKFKSHLNLVMINTPSSFKSTHLAQKIMKDFITTYNYKDYSLHIYNDANIEKGALNFAKTVDADLIGMCTHGRTGFAHFFNGSNSESLVNHAEKPVVTFKI